MTYGFIGAGNMAQTMIKGFIANNALAPDDICVYDIDPARQAEAVGAYGVRAAASACAVSRDAEVLVLAVKPDQLEAVLQGLPFDTNRPVLVSLPVGISLARIREMIGFDMPVVRIIPNISAEIFASVTAFCPNAHIGESERNGLIKTLAALGSVVCLPEKQLDIFTVIASCAPAFVAKFSEALADAALKEGLPKGTARAIIADMLLGIAKMLRQHDPYALIDRVSSPGGTTITGLTALTAHGFEAAIHAAARECMDKLKT